MAEVQLICFLLVIVAALDVFARRIGVPYPVLLVLSGLALSLVPYLPHVGFDPKLALLVFLPPLLYPAALFTSWRDFRRNIWPISYNAIGLVLLTTAAVAVVVRYLIPDMPWSAAVVLGAIVSPPDAVAATAVLQRIKVPRRVVAILEGESLVNDAVALIIYRFGIVAVMTGTFSLGEAVLEFPIVALGGVLIGWLVGMGVHWIQKRLDDPPVQITISLLAPFMAYLPAEQLELSGVLAVVTAGLYIGWRSPIIITPRTRLEVATFWRMVVFLLNGIIFILIGLQLPEVVKGLGDESWWTLGLYAGGVSAAVVLVRIVWVFAIIYVPELLSRCAGKCGSWPDWRNVSIVAWSGMRGVVSLAAALALPMTIGSGDSFPGRNYIIFLSFSVILVTLVAQGLTLPLLIRVLGVKDDGESQREELEARLKANEAALAYVDQRMREDGSENEHLSRLQAEYHERIAQLKFGEEVANGTADPEKDTASHYFDIVLAALQAERRTVIELRNSHHINDETLRTVQRDLDLAEARITGRQEDLLSLSNG